MPRHEPERAVRWLHDYRSDELAMLGLRSALMQHHWSAIVSGLDDSAVLRQFAGLIASGQIRVCGTAMASGSAGRVSAGATRSNSAPAAAPAPATPRPRPAGGLATAPAPSAEPSTLAADTDALAQAQTLIAAAAEGLPFCAECTPE